MKKNMYSLMCSLFAVSFSISSLNAQIAFTNSNSKLTNAASHSGCPTTICDWNNDGLDDIIHLDEGRYCYVEIQNTNAQYTRLSLGDFGGGAWAMTVADVDHNGYKDIIADGSNGIGLIKTHAAGALVPMIWLSNSGFFLQNATFADFNNDGWIDLFCCDDNDASHLYMNDQAGNLNISSFVDFALNPTLFYNGDPADSGNYGSAWIDFDNDGDMDLFVAHCRQSANSPSDLRRKDRLFVNDGSNNYTEQSSAYGIEVSAYNQTWTASFGDIDNDGDLDLLATNHDVPSIIMQNDGTGHFTDITASTNFAIPNFTPIESVMEDFDNDGWIDILITGDDSRFFLNNGNSTFTLVDDIFDNNDMESFSIGDLNHDGFVDVYASYATIYTNPSNIDDVVWLNNKNSNHFLTIQLQGTISNRDAIGGRATVYSALGTQVREVRSGESYGTCNSFQCHFGLGSLTTVDSVVIRFPSGTTQTIINPAVDQFIKVIENDCISPIANITYSGPLVLCPGQSVTLNAPLSIAGFTYLWSNGSTASNITVNQAGEYNVLITAPGNNCIGISPTMNLISNPDQTPTISSTAPLDLCAGQSLDLLAPAGAISYSWSNGNTTQNITVNQSGSYSLAIQGYCQLWNSNIITVDVHNSAISNVQNGIACVGGTADLTASGTGGNINWYDALIGGTLLYTGSTFTTPVITTTTDFYAEDFFSTNNPVSFMPPNDNAIGSGSYNTSTQRYLIFDVLAEMTLQSVKVFASSAGNRTIEIRDAANVVMQSITVNIPIGESRVNLGFNNIPVGTNYRLGLNSSSAVDLFRNDGGVSYPYNVNGLVSIKNSQAGSNYYYFFYDWEVHEQDIICTSPLRVAVTAVYDPNCIVGIAEYADNSLLTVFPNPATNFIQVELKTLVTGNVEIKLNDLTGKTVQLSSIENNTGNFKHTIDVGNLAKGFYMMNVKAGNQQWQRKVTVQ